MFGMRFGLAVSASLPAAVLPCVLFSTSSAFAESCLVHPSFEAGSQSEYSHVAVRRPALAAITMPSITMIA